MKIIDNKGFLLHMSFQGKKGIWHLCSTTSSNGNWRNTIDEFTNGFGEFISISRGKLYEYQELGAISAAPNAKHPYL